ncbi:MAG: hypothetical protein LBL85_02150 [Methanocalculaceae archaeon]|jgi:hypothetical protein|nr:hypothetical protein [Methanocalculaceae archaeon]
MGQKNDSGLPVVAYAVEKHIPVGACNAANFMVDHGYLDEISHTGNTLEFMMKSQALHYHRKRFCGTGVCKGDSAAAQSKSGRGGFGRV